MSTTITAAACAGQDDNVAREVTRRGPGPRSAYLSANGVNLHYLDWGGVGEPLVLLAGLNNTAFIFSDLAPRFTDRFHVVGLTRRGHGLSDGPRTGYDTGTRVEDIKALLDALRADKASFVGHSIAGNEMTLFAQLYPERVERLVYLEATYDDESLSRVMRNAPPPPAPSRDAGREAWRQHFISVVFGGVESAAVAEELENATNLPPDVVAEIVESDALSAIGFAAVDAPALAVFAVPDPSRYLPETDDQEYIAEMERFWDESFLPFQEVEIRRFDEDYPNGRVVRIPDSHHYVFLHHLDEVTRVTREFLLDPDPR